LPEGSMVEPVKIDSSDGLDILRHSTATLPLRRFSRCIPARLGIGPQSRTGSTTTSMWQLRSLLMIFVTLKKP
jgi:hypothetical protein